MSGVATNEAGLCEGAGSGIKITEERSIRRGEDRKKCKNQEIGTEQTSNTRQKTKGKKNTQKRRQQAMRNNDGSGNKKAAAAAAAAAQRQSRKIRNRHTHTRHSSRDSRFDGESSKILCASTVSSGHGQHYLEAKPDKRPPAPKRPATRLRCLERPAMDSRNEISIICCFVTVKGEGVGVMVRQRSILNKGP